MSIYIGKLIIERPSRTAPDINALLLKEEDLTELRTFFLLKTGILTRKQST